MSNAERMQLLRELNRTAFSNGANELSMWLNVNVVLDDVVSVAWRNTTQRVLRQEECKRGFWCSGGREIKCVRSTYNPRQNSDSASACLPCPSQNATADEQLTWTTRLDPRTGQPVIATSVRDCICKAGFFLSNGACISCLVGMDCAQEGLTLGRLPLRPGYWRPSNVSLAIQLID